MILLEWDALAAKYRCTLGIDTNSTLSNKPVFDLIISDYCELLWLMLLTGTQKWPSLYHLTTSRNLLPKGLKRKSRLDNHERFPRI